ncbi:MAG: hypothetical protein ACRDOE_14630, partial [Streptosporangiaceae bacterium]
MVTASQAASSTTAVVQSEMRTRMLRQPGDALSACGSPLSGIEARSPSDQRERPKRKVASHRKVQYFIAALIAIAAAALAAQIQDNGYYTVAERGGRAWLVTPAGSPVLVLALNHVHLISATAPRTDLAPAYVDQRAGQVLSWMQALGFNALGGDADADLWHRGLPYLELLDISHHLQAEQQTPMVDVYAADFAGQVAALAQAACVPRARDPELIGYFSDDGLDWDPSLHAAEMLRYYLKLPLSAPGRQRAMDYLRIRYGSDIRAANRAWGVKARDFLELSTPAPGGEAAFAADAAGFANQVLVRYLQTTADAIHAADPNHLYL